MYSHIIIWKKPNGELLYRATQYDSRREIGDVNNYGWSIVGIQKIQKGKCYSLKDYNALLLRRKKWSGLTTNIQNIFDKVDPIEILKWAFIGYVMLNLCQ